MSPKWISIIYNGSNSMVAGNICVSNKLNKPIFFAKKLNRENAYPDIAARTTPVNVTVSETIALFRTQSKNGCSVKSLTYDLSVAFAGIISNEVESSLSAGRSEIVTTCNTG